MTDAQAWTHACDDCLTILHHNQQPEGWTQDQVAATKATANSLWPNSVIEYDSTDPDGYTITHKACGTCESTEPGTRHRMKVTTRD